MKDKLIRLPDIFGLNKSKNFWNPYVFAQNSITDGPPHSLGLIHLTAQQFIQGVVTIRDQWENNPYGLVNSLGKEVGFGRSIAIRELIRNLRNADFTGNYGQYIDDEIFDYILKEYRTFSERAHLFSANSEIASIASVGRLLGIVKFLGDDEPRKLDSYFVQHSKKEVEAMPLEYSTVMAWLFFSEESELTDRERILIAAHFNYNTNFGAEITPEILSERSMLQLSRLGKTLMREGRDPDEREKKSVQHIVSQIYPE